MIRKCLRLLVIAPVAWVIVGAAAWAGPPLICHPVEIGDAKSIPFGRGAVTRSEGYDFRTYLVEDTLTILDRMVSLAPLPSSSTGGNLRRIEEGRPAKIFTGLDVISLSLLKLH